MTAEGTLGEVVFRAAAPMIGTQAQSLLARGASLDAYAVLIVHRSSPQHALVEREGAQVLDDGTVLRLEPRATAVTWLHARGHNTAARELDQPPSGERLMVVALCDETAELYWLAKPSTDATTDRGVRLLPSDEDAWKEEHVERLGMDLVVAAHELAIALEQGAPPHEVVYVRIETDCRLFGPMREAVATMPGGETSRPDGEAFTAVMSRTYIDKVMREFTGNGMMAAAEGRIGLVHMTRSGIVSQNARLVRMTDAS